MELQYDSEPVRIKMEDSAPDGHGSTHPSSSETGPLVSVSSLQRKRRVLLFLVTSNEFL